MAPRKSQLTWVWWYWDLQYLLMASVFKKNIFYILEGDSEIILRAYEFFKSIEHAMDNKYEWRSVSRVFNDAICLILKRRDIFMYQKQISSTKLDTEILTVIESNEKVQGINNDK